MAKVKTWFTTDNKIGVDLNRVVTSDLYDDPAYPAPAVQLGQRVQANNGSEWIYVEAFATVSSYNLVAIDKDNKAHNATDALVASAAYTYGIAHFPPDQMGTLVSVGAASGGVANTGDRFWALMRAVNGSQVNVHGAAALGSMELFISATPGVLTSSAGASGFPIYPLEVPTTATTVMPVEVAMPGYLTPRVSA